MIADGKAPVLPPMELVELLADGELHSGEELALLSGVSRAAISKQLAKCGALGLELSSAPGKGYRLVGGLDLLNKDRLLANLPESVRQSIFQLDVLQIVDSTNAFLLREPASTHLSVCIAECQTAGRGRRGRVWVSPFAKNLYMSLKMTVEAGIGALEGLSLAVGVAIAKVLNQLGAKDVGLKWPNDVLWCDRKLGGVLIEVTGEPAGRCHLVLGVGLNLVADSSMQTGIDQPWVTLHEIIGKKPDRNEVAALLLAELAVLLESFEADGFIRYQQDWNRLNVHAGKLVVIRNGVHETQGVMRGVNQVGALLLQLEGGEQVFHGGEISLRGSL